MSEFKKEKTYLGENTTHPSYGMLGFSRTTGGKTNLFGSSIQHRDTIVMELRHGEITRGLNTNWYYGGKTIAKVEMSQSQFAEAITSLNMGTGIPVTVRYTENDGVIGECDFVNKQEQFQDELKKKLDSIDNVASTLYQEVKDILTNKKSLNKSDKEEILAKISKIVNGSSSNTSFAYDCFNEQMDKTVREAKGEIEAFYQNKVNSIAQATLVEHKEELQKLDNPVDM